MKSSLVALAVLPLALAVAACEGPPAAEPVTATEGAQFLPPSPVTSKIPLATTVLIDFDNSPSGPVASGTIIDTLYTSEGVTFSCVACSSGHVFAMGDGSGNNDVTLWSTSLTPGFDARFGAVEAAFSTAKSSVSIEVLPQLPAEPLGTVVAEPFLEAFDSAGNLLQKAYYPFTFGQTGWGTVQRLSVSSSTSSIAYVLFSSQAPGGTVPVYGVFDNLRFNGRPLLQLP